VLIVVVAGITSWCGRRSAAQLLLRGAQSVLRDATGRWLPAWSAGDSVPTRLRQLLYVWPAAQHAKTARWISCSSL